MGGGRFVFSHINPALYNLSYPLHVINYAHYYRNYSPEKSHTYTHTPTLTIEETFKAFKV